MNKEVLYIDVDDDITAIISKVKAAEAKVVALVPPKRIGVLQSAVNLRILQRVAKVAKKHVVLITNDNALMMLAAGANIPVAKNLQSKPEVLEVPALQVDGEDDIIDGASLSVGEHIDASTKQQRASEAAAVAAISADEAKKDASAVSEVKKPAKKTPKVPNFNHFRKKLFIAGGVLVALVAFLIWATKYAPRATVVVSAKTSTESVSTSISLLQSGVTSAEKGLIRSVVATDKKDTTIEFAATGKREEGERASGTMTISSTTPVSVKIPIGTGFSNGNCTFTTTSAVEVPGVSPGWNGSGFSVVPGKVNVAVKATQIGDECNLSPRSYEPTIEKVAATGSAMQGGSKRQVTFVTQADVQKASEQIAQASADERKAALQKKLGKGVQVIDSSFAASEGTTTSTPEVNKEAPDGKAKLVASVTYSMTGIAHNELHAFLEQALLQKLSKETSRRVYETGAKDAVISEFKQDGGSVAARITAKGQVGPKVSDDDIKRRTKGKRFGDIQADLKSIQGVNGVDVKFSPFWVNTVPNDESRITVQFNLQKNGQ